MNLFGRHFCGMKLVIVETGKRKWADKKKPNKHSILSGFRALIYRGFKNLSCIKCIFYLHFRRRESSGIPGIVKKCIAEVERRGMNEIGIYRVSGVASEIQALKASFDTSKYFPSRQSNVTKIFITKSTKYYLAVDNFPTRLYKNLKSLKKVDGNVV